MTPERIAELRRLQAEYHKCLSRISGPMGFPYHYLQESIEAEKAFATKLITQSSELLDAADALLAECERAAKLERVLKHWLAIEEQIGPNYGRNTSMIEETKAALTPPKQAGAQTT